MASTRYLVLRYSQLRAQMIAHQTLPNGAGFTIKLSDELNRVYSELYRRTDGFTNNTRLMDGVLCINRPVTP